MESPNFLSHPRPRGPCTLVWCSVQLLQKGHPPKLGLGIRMWRIKNRRGWNWASERLSHFPRSHSQVTKMGFQPSQGWLCLIENFSLHWTENHFSLELHPVALTLRLGSPKMTLLPPPFDSFQVCLWFWSFTPMFACCDSSYGWFNTSLFIEGRKYLQWLTKRWDFLL